MHVAKEAVLPTHSDAQVLADQFAEYNDDKIDRICKYFQRHL